MQATLLGLGRPFRIVCLTLLCAGCSGDRVARDADVVGDLMRRMSLEEKAGQLFFGFIHAARARSGSEELTTLLKLVREEHLGGVVISLGTARQAGAAVRALDRAARYPLLFAADFEAGVGYRLEGGTRFPYSLAFTATGLPRLAEAAARATALEGKALGIDWTLHPVADVNADPKNPIINVRSFGERPAHVAAFVRAAVRGYEDAGMPCCLKHFPGHGNVSQDSHLTLPVVPGRMESWLRGDAVPFRAGIAAGASSLMTGHLALPAFDDPERPATMSPKILGDVLRERLRFRGLVVSDALEMHAITERRGAGEAALEALQAGCDALLMSPDVPNARRTIVDAVLGGEVDAARLDAAVRAVLELKQRAGVLRQRVATRPEATWSRLGSHRELAREVCRRAITVVRDAGHRLPLEALGDRPVLAVVTGAGESRGDALLAALRERASAFERIIVTPHTDPAPLQDATTLVLALMVRVREFSGTIGLPPALRKKLGALKSPVVVSFGNPYLLGELPNARTYVVAYDTGADMERAAAAALSGTTTVDGRLPVTIPGHAAYGAGHTIGALTDEPRACEPQTEGLAANLEQRVARYVASAIRRRVFPGCQIVVMRRNGIVLDAAYGHETYDRGARRVTRSTRYDLASLTKVVCTTAVAMALDTAGKLRLDAPVKDLVPAFRGGNRDGVTVRQLLTHSSGLTGWKPLYKSADTRDEVVAAIMREPLEYEPGRSMEYSDLGFILLGVCLERAGGAPLDDLARELVFEPLRMTATSFGPIPSSVAVAPTEVDPRRGGLVHRVVHDENAAAMGGVAGHAGLFSTARDVARFVRCVLAGGRLGGAQPFSRSVTELYTARAGIVIDSSRALGFDTPYPNSHAGRLMSPRSIGHTGFTGTSMQGDKSRDLVVVCLTNRVHPVRDNKQIKSFRRGLHDLVIESLDLDLHR